MDSRVTMETFLKGCAGMVTIVVGPAGSGKTLLMSCLGQQWAQRLVRLKHSSFRVRQVNCYFLYTLSGIQLKSRYFIDIPV